MRKLWEWRNRIIKLVPGQTRIWATLGEAADELQIDIDLTELHPDAREKLEGLVLKLKRMEYDLIVLNEVAHGKEKARGVGRSDPNHWRGPRP